MKERSREENIRGEGAKSSVCGAPAGIFGHPRLILLYLLAVVLWMGYDRASYQRNKADALFRMGFHAEVVGKIEEAAVKYEKAIKADPRHYRSYVQLSRLYARKGDEGKAAHYKNVAERCRIGDSPERPPEMAKRAPPPSLISRVLEVPAQEAIELDKDDEVRKMLPHVWGYFFGRFDSLREVQRLSVPIVLRGHNAMIIAPTASGKTEAIFAPLAERLVSERWTGLSVLYISPTKALAEDIAQRLMDMVDGLDIRVAQRNGDTKTFDERNPQNILVTTPESLDSLMGRRPECLRDIKAVVLDELHMLDGSYRGDQLRVLLRRMRYEMRSVPAFYATTATVSDPETMAARYMPNAKLVRSGGGRGIEYRIVPTLEHAAMQFRELGARKALLFCNTPHEAEELARVELKRHFPLSTVKVHHGKLDATMRMDAESALRNGRDVVCACTSTLEVGVDIGDIDVVMLVRRPRSVASLSQRIGRGNRREDRIKVVALASTAAEALYYEKVFNAVSRSEYDTARYGFDPSVAVQQIMSSLVGGRLRPDESIFTMFEGLLPEKDVQQILAQLAEDGWIELDGNDWKATARIVELGPGVFSNIPGYDSIQVVDMASGSTVGNIGLPIDNIFVLAGQAWLVRQREGNKVMVTAVDQGTEVANFASYDRFGAFFDMLPYGLRLRMQQRRDDLRAETGKP